MRASTWTASKVGFNTISESNSTAWFKNYGSKERVYCVNYLETLTSIFPPSESMISYILSLEYLDVPVRDPWATKLETELLLSVYCLLPAFTSTVMLNCYTRTTADYCSRIHWPLESRLIAFGGY